MGISGGGVNTCGWVVFRNVAESYEYADAQQVSPFQLSVDSA